VFRYSLILKAVHSAIELIAGVMLHVTSSDSILRVARALTRHELLEHPDDLVAKTLLRAAESFSIDQKTTATVYLLSHGVVEFFLVVMILRNRIWAYPVYMVALGLLILCAADPVGCRGRRPHLARTPGATVHRGCRPEPRDLRHDIRSRSRMAVSGRCR
jgi:hypothetical protein